MDGYPRFAIYFTPQADSSLYRFGANLLGYDAYTGLDLPFPNGIETPAADWRELTSEPRRYGFHATLKAPFALAFGCDEEKLAQACADFADTPRVIPSIAPVVRSIGSFIAMTPALPSDDLARLADACVVAFERFRAPLSSADRARRKPEALTTRQVEYLDRWGYPYVMEEFRFHMTLSGRIDADRRAGLAAMLQSRFAALGMRVVAIDGFALFRQADPSARFRVLERWTLRPVSTEPAASP